MPNTIFAVVGEHRENPDRLLLIGDDGHHYECANLEDNPTPVEPIDDETWRVDDGTDPDALFV